MKDRPRKFRSLTLFAFVIIIFFIFLVNLWVENQLGSGRKRSAGIKINVNQEGIKPEGQEKRPREIVRKMRLDPSRKFTESVFFLDDRQIAGYKSMREEIFDIMGEIPDGKVSFINETRRTYGEEYYRNGQRHGMYREFFSDGNIKKEVEYSYGKVKNVKEYYIDGQVRMEVDLYDALIFRGKDEEAGAGKLYFRDGTLKYEWSLTNMNEHRYRKAYNIKGELIQLDYFDHNGHLKRTIKY